MFKVIPLLPNRQPWINACRKMTTVADISNFEGNLTHSGFRVSKAHLIIYKFGNVLKRRQYGLKYKAAIA